MAGDLTPPPLGPAPEFESDAMSMIARCMRQSLDSRPQYWSDLSGADQTAIAGRGEAPASSPLVFQGPSDRGIEGHGNFEAPPEVCSFCLQTYTLSATNPHVCPDPNAPPPDPAPGAWYDG